MRWLLCGGLSLVGSTTHEYQTCRCWTCSQRWTTPRGYTDKRGSPTLQEDAAIQKTFLVNVTRPAGDEDLPAQTACDLLSKKKNINLKEVCPVDVRNAPTYRSMKRFWRAEELRKGARVAPLRCPICDVEWTGSAMAEQASGAWMQTKTVLYFPPPLTTSVMILSFSHFLVSFFFWNQSWSSFPPPPPLPSLPPHCPEESFNLWRRQRVEHHAPNGSVPQI